MTVHRDVKLLLIFSVAIEAFFPLKRENAHLREYNLIQLFLLDIMQRQWPEPVMRAWYLKTQPRKRLESKRKLDLLKE